MKKAQEQEKLKVENDKKTKVKVCRLSLHIVDTPSGPRVTFDTAESTYAEILQIPADFSDGSRYIVMNNGDTVVYAVYSSVASFQMYDEYHLNLEKILFEKMREMLGFKRIF